MERTGTLAARLVHQVQNDTHVVGDGEILFNKITLTLPSFLLVSVFQRLASLR